MSKLIKFFILLTYLLTLRAVAFENLVYTWRGFPTEIPQGIIAIADLKKHANKIDLLSSQAYHIDENGVLDGAVNPKMTAIAQAHHIKLIPLVGNKNLDRTIAHLFLKNPAAQERAIQSVLQLCKRNHYAGVQIDFEDMSLSDREAFTHFYQKIARVLHKNNFQIAIAIIPTLSEKPPMTDYLKSRYNHFSGVYDYKALGKSSDFVTLMTYDQHGGITPPGPMSGLTWNEAIIQVALKYIPAAKISLGIPWHSGYWYTGRDSDPENSTDNKKIQVVQTDFSYADMQHVLKNNHAVLRWNDQDKIHYAIFINHFLYEYIYAEDAASFKAKLNLVKKYKLRGISNWCLGEEDPKVWDLLSTKQN